MIYQTAQRNNQQQIQQGYQVGDQVLLRVYNPSALQGRA